MFLTIPLPPGFGWIGVLVNVIIAIVVIVLAVKLWKSATTNPDGTAEKGATIVENLVKCAVLLVWYIVRGILGVFDIKLPARPGELFKSDSNPQGPTMGE
jgi:Mg2+/Co2+ transporter CorB